MGKYPTKGQRLLRVNIFQNSINAYKSKTFGIITIKMIFSKLILFFAATSHQEDLECGRSVININERSIVGCNPIVKTFDAKHGCKFRFYEAGKNNRREGVVEHSCSRIVQKEILWDECTEAKIRPGFKSRETNH